MEESVSTGSKTIPANGRVCIWCVPRCRSTVLAKCLSGIQGISVWMAPYSYASTAATVYQDKTGSTLPLECRGNEGMFDDAMTIVQDVINLKLCRDTMGFLDIKHQLESEKSRYVLLKDQAYFFEPNHASAIPSGYKHTFLIREPSRVFFSFRQALIRRRRLEGCRIDNDTFDMTSDERFVSAPFLACFKRQFKLWEYICENIDSDPVIVDSYDLASKPKSVIESYCKKTGLPFSDSLLSWSPSDIQSMGWNLPADSGWEEQNHFYSSALKSTCYVTPQEEGPMPRDQLTNDILQCVEASTAYYQQMYKYKLQV